MKAAKKKRKTARKPARRRPQGARIAAPIVRDDEPVNCDECGHQLRVVRLEKFDFTAWSGIPIILRDVPGLRCASCGGETIPGHVVNASLAAVGFDCIQLPYRLPAATARYVRRFLEITQQELADRMGIARETVAQWECGERDISPQHDLILRGMVIERAHGDMSHLPQNLLIGLLPILGSVKSEPPPRQSPLALPPRSVEMQEFFPTKTPKSASRRRAELAAPSPTH